MKSVPYTKPSITNLEVKYAKDAAKNGWGKKCYDYIYKFEKIFKRHLNTRYSISTSSCTGALHMGMHALGISRGDEVILADTNWVATAAPIIHLGAKPIYVDILPDTWCIDPDKIENAITKKTKAIIAVHLYGNLCDMDKILKIGKKYNIPIIEDSAEALGSIYKKKRAGTIGKFGTFSFHGTKTITTGEGGMFVTNDKKLYEEVLTLNNHGRKKNEIKQFWPSKIGYKYKISDLQAALGCAQMTRINTLVNKKRYILNSYKKKLNGIKSVALNPEPKNTINGAWMPNLVFSKKSKVNSKILYEEFNKENIDARVFFVPLSSTPPMQKYKKTYYKNKNSFSIASRSINLPSYHNMTEKDIDRVCDVIFKVVKKYKCT